MSTKKLKRTLAVVLAVAMVMGSAMTTFASSGSGSSASSSGGSTTTSGASTSETSTTTTSDKQTNTVVDSTSGKVIQSTMPGSYTATTVNGTAVLTSKKLFNELAGVKNSYVIIRNSACGENAQKVLEEIASAFNVPVGPVFDFYITKSATSSVNEITELGGNVAIMVGIPKEMRAGDMEFGMIRVTSSGVKYLPDCDLDPNTVTFETDKTGVYMLVSAVPGYFDVLK